MRMPGSAHVAGADDKPARRRRLAALVASTVLLSTLAGGLYLVIGPPELLSAAAAARGVSPDGIDDMVAQVEAHLAAQRRTTVAPGRFSHRFTCGSANTKSPCRAWQNAQRLLGESAERQENLGESLVAAAGGTVTADAKAAFDRAVTIDGNTVAARFYLGRAAAQAGRREEAAKIWGDLVASAPAAAPWAGGGACGARPPRRPTRRAAIRTERFRHAGRRQAAARAAGRDGPRHGRAPGHSPARRRRRPGRLDQAGALLQRAGLERARERRGRRCAHRAGGRSREAVAFRGSAEEPRLRRHRGAARPRRPWRRPTRWRPQSAAP